MNTTAMRLPDVETGFPEGFDYAVMSYWKTPRGWSMNLTGDVFANLRAHRITEHEDGTITVSPSILVTAKGTDVHRHGYLKRGVWEPCADDRP